jgi:hypothetical protein
MISSSLVSIGYKGRIAIPKYGINRGKKGKKGDLEN